MKKISAALFLAAPSSGAMAEFRATASEGNSTQFGDEVSRRKQELHAFLVESTSGGEKTPQLSLAVKHNDQHSYKTP